MSAASVDREALIDVLNATWEERARQTDPEVGDLEWLADALIAAGMVNRPEAVVRDEALRSAIKTAGGYANLDAHPDEIVKALHALRASLKEALA